MIQLYIDNQQVDITQSVGLYLNKRFEDLQNPTKYYSEYSKTITLPMTPTNKKIFNNYNRQDSVVTTTTIDPRVKVPFYLLYNSKLVMDGYCKINNANTIYDDQCFEIELYSAFGMVMNEMSQLTFNKYETVSYGGEKDDKYLITSPFSDIVIDRTLVKDSFEQNLHNLNGTDVLDYIKFVPTYQGYYPDFNSDKQQLLSNRIEDMSRQRDEHYKREFRSYYQQPSIWVDKLWKMVKDKIEEITDYTMVFDSSWFNNFNPYWTKLIYTCPSLFNNDDNFTEYLNSFVADSDNYIQNINNMSHLSQHHGKKVFFSPNGDLCHNGNFNEDRMGYTQFYCKTSIMLLAHKPNAQYESSYCKIRKSNPLYVSFSARSVETNEVLAQKTYLLYSCSHNQNTNTFDEAIDVGITNSINPKISNGYPEGYGYGDGYWWEAPVEVTLNINENVPYYISVDSRFSNNSKAVEYAAISILPRWDWMWRDFFWTSQNGGDSGYTIFSNVQSARVKTVDYKRSGSEVDMYRIFPKDTTLQEVILNYSKMFGLLWDVNQDEKTITIMTRNKFFTGYEIKDWTDKVDRQHDFVLEPLCFSKRYVSFNFEEGKGSRLTKYKGKYGVSYGSKKIDTDYQFNNETEELYKGIQPSIVATKSQFSYMTNTEYADRPNFMGYNYKIYPDEHYIDNDEDGGNAGNSGAFYFVNGTFVPDERLGLRNRGYTSVLVSDDTPYMVSENNYCWNVSGINEVICTKLPDVSTIDQSGQYSIHFEKPALYYTNVDTSNTRYVYDLFWKDFINERYNVQNKKLTAYFYLTPSEYNDVKFRDFVKINNTLYHVNQVFDYDFDTNSPVKVELVQVWNVTAYTEGQKDWPNLTVDTSTLEVSMSEYRDVVVYSSGTWVVDTKPSWITYTIDGDILSLRATSNPIRSRTGEVKIKTTGIPFMTDIITVYQKPDNVYLNLDSPSATVNADGNTVVLNIASSTGSLTVDSKPRWCSVTFFPRFQTMTREEIYSNRNILTSRRNNTLTNFTATISVNANMSYNIRRGTIVFNNGEMTKSFSLVQTGRAVIIEEFDDTIAEISIGNTGTWSWRTNRQLITDPAVISNGTLTQPTNLIDAVNITYTPTLNVDDHGDNTTETCSGGQVSVVTKDGSIITKNYNYGEVTHTYEVIIRGSEGGSTTIDGNTYTTTFYETMTENTTVSVTAVPDEGNTFEGWSDGVQTASRTLTVTGNIDIWPIFETDYYLYDTGDNVEFDNEDNIKY